MKSHNSHFLPTSKSIVTAIKIFERNNFRLSFDTLMMRVIDNKIIVLIVAYQ